MATPLIPFTIAWLIGIWIASRFALPSVALGVAAGVALLGEPFTPGTGIGFVLILAGSWLATGIASAGAGPREAREPVPSK